MGLRRARGILKVKRRDVPGVLNRAKHMAKGLGDNASLFTNPSPALAVFNNQIAATDAAQVVAGDGGKGKAAARDVQVGVLMRMMEAELLYMQSVADTGTPDEAVATLHAGGVEVATFTKYDKAILAVTAGPTAGSVKIEANAGALLGATATGSTASTGSTRRTARRSSPCPRRPRRGPR